VECLRAELEVDYVGFLGYHDLWCVDKVTGADCDLLDRIIRAIDMEMLVSGTDSEHIRRNDRNKAKSDCLNQHYEE